MRTRARNLWPLALALALAGCAALQMGADPLIVRTEQTQTVARATFDLVLNVDHADRGFWRTNAPLFHRFCEDLRRAVPYGGSNVARVLATELQVDDLKRSYQASKTDGTARALDAALAVLTTLTRQAASWEAIVTNRW